MTESDTRYSVQGVNGMQVIDASLATLVFFLAQKESRDIPLDDLTVLVYGPYDEVKQKWNAQEFFEENYDPKAMPEVKRQRREEMFPESKPAPMVESRSSAMNADDELVSPRSSITYGMVRKIRKDTAEFFMPNPPKGKIACYKALAKELELGLETVAKIARGNVYEDVR